MTEQELKEIEAGLKRWHSVSTETAQKLVDEIRKLRHNAAMEQMHLDLVYRERDDAYSQLDLFKEKRMGEL